MKAKGVKILKKPSEKTFVTSAQIETKYVSDKGFVFRIYKVLINP